MFLQTIHLARNQPDLLITFDSDALLADLDGEAALALFVVEVTDDGDSSNEQANHKEKCVAVHYDQPFARIEVAAFHLKIVLLTPAALTPCAEGYSPRRASFRPPMAF